MVPEFLVFQKYPRAKGPKMIDISKKADKCHVYDIVGLSQKAS